MALLRSQSEKDLIGRYSSFMSVEKTLADVVQLLLKNERLKRLLYYTDRHALGLPKLTQEQTYSLIGNQIRIVPKLTVDFDAKPYVIISLDKFTPMENQTTFRSVQMSIDILCPFEHWQLDDFKLRPYSIAGEIDAMVNNSFISGIGVADFIGAQQLIINDNWGGISLYYNVETYGDDTKRHLPEKSWHLIAPLMTFRPSLVLISLSRVWA